LRKIKDRTVDNLINALVSLENEEQCWLFLQDLCTITEIKSMAQRLEVARLLEDGFVYSEIAQKTGSSTATISRVKRCLDYGDGGYKMILDRNYDNLQIKD
jgi:TrpR-related protein YerC/YecD